MMVGKVSKMPMFWTASTKLRMKLIMCLCWYLLLVGVDSLKTDPNEESALRSIRRSLIDPQRHLRHWNRGDPCTAPWPGVFCYNKTSEDGYYHVRELSFLNKNLSGTLSPEVGRLSQLMILDIMWNNISGPIPKEIGSITTLELLLLSGNQLSGSLPDELGNLSNLNRIQIDQNQISGPIPQSFANLTKGQHFHMNNCSLSGTIPAELARLPILIHLLLDNNNLSGPLPPELSEMPDLQILQLDNNNLGGSSIPPSYGNMSNMLKLSMRNCSLRGPIPDWSNSPQIAYIDLSLNSFTGTIPTGSLSKNITTIDLSSNNLNGALPTSFSNLPILQKLSVANNSLNGSIPSNIWENRISKTERLILDFGFNRFSNISGNQQIPTNISIGLQGNPICSTNNNLVKSCGPHVEDFDNTLNATNYKCPNECRPHFEYSPATPTMRCFCAAPVYVGYRLKSPVFSDFLPYVNSFKEYISSGLKMNASQLAIDSAEWQKGPRLSMYMKIFPAYVNDTVDMLSKDEVFWIREAFGGWQIPESHVFGPYEFLNFTLRDPYIETPPRSGLSKGALAGTILGTIAGSVTISAIVSLLILRWHIKKFHNSSKRRSLTRISMRIDGVKDFSYNELAEATNDFDSMTVVGQGGYGKVHRGILSDGTVVAIKRALEGSLQGEKEFLTEIQLLSRLHHRNLVSLVGYCDEDGEQMLIYEFMPNGTLRDHLSSKSKASLTFATRVKIALDTAKGILYLHTEANPPIFHRDIKASNILLDSRFSAKVSDFGLSRLAPVPDIEGDIPSHVSTVVRGTPGYLDPEYFLTHKMTDKSDVYSLGVVFLEMVTGKHPISHGKNIVREVNFAHRAGSILTIIDEKMASFPSDCVEKFINLGLRCCREETSSRPSMTEVVRELESLWRMLPESDTNLTDSSAADSGDLATPPSSTVPCMSSLDVSGSDLVSGTLPAIAPR